MIGLSPPLLGFHFLVAFGLPKLRPNDFRFQSVSGLNARLETTALKEGGGETRQLFLPTGVVYEDLVLSRGLFTSSGIYQWCEDAIQRLDIKPVNILISLLDDQHLPLANWQVVNAYPYQWEIGAFNALENKVVIETLKLKYERFERIKLF